MRASMQTKGGRHAGRQRVRYAWCTVERKQFKMYIYLWCACVCDVRVCMCVWKHCKKWKKDTNSIEEKQQQQPRSEGEHRSQTTVHNSNSNSSNSNNSPKIDSKHFWNPWLHVNHIDCVCVYVCVLPSSKVVVNAGSFCFGFLFVC